VITHESWVVMVVVVVVVPNPNSQELEFIVHLLLLNMGFTASQAHE
jgi:hypothetical protein